MNCDEYDEISWISNDFDFRKFAISIKIVSWDRSPHLLPCWTRVEPLSPLPRNRNLNHYPSAFIAQQEEYDESRDKMATLDPENNIIGTKESRNSYETLSIRQILQQVNHEQYTIQNEGVQDCSDLEISDRSIKNRIQTVRERRSRSHPVHNYANVDDYAYIETNRISRNGTNSSLTRNESTDINANDKSSRSSTHSTASSIATSFTASSADDQSLLTAEAIWDHVAILPDELPFASGDSITILDYSSHPELWYGSCGESTGWFPSSYVRLINGTAPERSNSLPSFPQSLRHLRKQIIEELMSTERDYVHLLQDLVEGFVFQTRKRIEMFSSDCIQRLFANIEAIRTFHCKFLRELELSLNQNLLEDSYIGAVFLRNRAGFMIYSEYCNNRPISCAELLALNEKPHYHQFFEACRLLRGMPKLSLEGFLLTPVQRICRYPLQLAELLKATPVSHVDREPVQAATTAMKNIAAMINEKKRRLEGLQKIALWQKNVDGWRGPDLFETNSRMIRSGEVSCRCIINAEIVWHKDVLLFLFDQSIVICKKDLIRRHHYLFKDRLSLIKAKLIDCTDGRDSHLGITLKNAWKLITMGKELIFSCKDKNDKREWIEQILKRVECSPPTAEERRLVRDTLCSIYAKSEMAPLYLKTSGRFSWKKNKN